MLFFFDTLDGESWLRDEVGLEMPNIGAAHQMANNALADMVRDQIPNVTQLNMAVWIRDQAGNEVGVAKLVMNWD